jgi:heme exporter protein B
MKAIIKRELKVQNKIYNLTKYTLIFLAFCTLSITQISTHENIQIFGVKFSIACIPLAFIGLSNNLIKPDIEDGSLETSLTSIEPIKIIFAKYIALCTGTIGSFVLILPVIIILYNIDIKEFTILSIAGILLITLSAALAVLIATIQGYFRTNTNFLSILIMPSIIPSIIMTGLLIQNPDDLHLASIMFGINLLIIPIALYLSSYLLENIYNI